MEKTIKIFTKECLTKDGKKFLTYSTKIKNTFYRVKFTRDVDTLPKKQGYYNLTFDTSYASIQKQKVDLANNAFQNYNDILWISQVEKLEEESVEEAKQRREEALKDVF